MGFLLYIIATILFLVLAPVSIICTIFYCFVNFRFWMLERYFYWIAYAIDQLGNVVCQYLFNWCLISKAGYKFGLPDETVSSVLGKNYQLGTLTFAGRCLERFLHFLDENHSVDAIEEDEVRV